MSNDIQPQALSQYQCNISTFNEDDLTDKSELSERTEETVSEESVEDTGLAEIGEVIANQKITYSLFKAFMDW